jgi:hypothetical protein
MEARTMVTGQGEGGGFEQGEPGWRGGGAGEGDGVGVAGGLGEERG